MYGQDRAIIISLHFGRMSRMATAFTQGQWQRTKQLLVIFVLKNNVHAAVKQILKVM
jgi:hypothetical protein